jgi:cytochrome c biogenesis protein CcdA
MSLLVFAFGAGVLATVNPCGFVMLPAFLSLFLGTDDSSARPRGGHARSGKSVPARIGHGLAVGLAVSAGFSGVFTAVGLLISVGLRPLMQAMPWAAVVVGAVLVLAGLMMASGKQITVPLTASLDRRGLVTGRGWRAMIAFGGGYAVASLSCTQASTAAPVQAVLVFAAYAAGSATVLTAFAVAAALAQVTLGRAVRRGLPVLSRLGGAVLALSGAYLVVYWLPVLTGHGPARQVAALSQGPSAAATGFLDGHQFLLGMLGAVLAIVAGIALLLPRMKRHDSGVSAVADNTVSPAGDTDCCTAPVPSAPAVGSAGLRADEQQDGRAAAGRGRLERRTS